MLFNILFFILLGCSVSWFTIDFLLRFKLGQSINSTSPQHHHTHSGVIPRIGGVGIIGGFAVTYSLCFLINDANNYFTVEHFAVLGGALGAFTLGLADDFFTLGAKPKLLLQISIALIAFYCGLSIETLKLPFTEAGINLGPASVPVTVIWFVAIMNLINLIDGLDGLAGGIGCMLMMLLAYLAISKGSFIPGFLAIGMFGAIVGFLFHNFPPAKVYMGDSGAYSIGYVIAALSLLNAEKGAVVAALAGPVLALALPIVDVTYAILRRSIQGLPLFRADRGHIHHRLMGLGLNRTKTVLILYAVSLVSLFAGLLAFAEQGRYLPILIGAAAFVLLIVMRGQKLSLATVQAHLADSLDYRIETRNAISLKNWFVLEAERADSGSHLWSDYHFILKKMGFCRAEMSLGEMQRSFHLPDALAPSSDALLGSKQVIRGEITGELALYAERDNCSERRFKLLVDIALEAWTEASAHWYAVNQSPLTFEAQARSADNYRSQKARNLYRPTY
jgi:UDP-GlcNAc:undecaprenyl-phosphate GlcNAc-1-phosphate transferase